MKLISHLFVFIFGTSILFFPIDSFSQPFFKSGDLLQSYYDVNPDSLIIYTPCIEDPNGWDEEYYHIDINGDLINDIEFYGFCFQAAGAQSNYVRLKSLNNNTFIRYGRTDSSFNSFQGIWFTAKIAYPLLIGDTINQTNAIWDTLLFTSYLECQTFSCQNPTDWSHDSTDKYIGIKYINHADTTYGWIRVNAFRGCLIEDYSFELSPIGIEEINLNKIKIYPNPANNKIHIDQMHPQITEIKIYDLIGQECMHFLNNISQNFEIDISTLNSGIYFIIVKSSEKIYIEKIIVEK